MCVYVCVCVCVYCRQSSSCQKGSVSNESHAIQSSLPRTVKSSALALLTSDWALPTRTHPHMCVCACVRVCVYIHVYNIRAADNA